jgi:hypothetical protein
MYINIRRRLRDAVRRKRPEKWRINGWFLLHKTSANRPVMVKIFFKPKNNMTTLEHPQYSPDLGPVDLYLFT